MTDRPIIFSASMVRALLDGRKTMTRRLAWRSNGKEGEHFVAQAMQSPWTKVGVGQRLWVRENRWRNGGYAATDKPSIANDGMIPSIHMPRFASRLTLLVTARKVERVQDINETDAKAEGVLDIEFPDGRKASPVLLFRALWCKLHGDESWEENPEIVCLSFKVIPENVDALAAA